ncbi:MFS transporter [Bacillus smithii]|uniref:MFS transporter n=2 Tax=Bacillus smithii TaxID=1479 RepID=UPI0030C8E6E7
MADYTPSLTSNHMRKDILILITLALGFVMATLDVTIVNVAVSTIQKTLYLGGTYTTWIIDSYMVTFASLLLLGGTLAQRYGGKTIYMLGLSIFIISSLFCAMALNGSMLIIGRLFQGIGAALFMPSSLSLLSLSFADDKKRAKMFGLWSAIVSIASGCGPFVGGLLVNEFGWRSVFIINIPIGIIGFIMAYIMISESEKIMIELYLRSHILAVFSISLLSYVLIEGPTYGWLSTRMIGIICITLCLISAFIYKEMKSHHSIIPISLFKNRFFTGANVIGVCINLSLFGGIFMFGMFLQHAKGLTLLMAGVQLLPMMAVFVLGNILFSTFINRWSVEWIMFVALVVASICTIILVITVGTNIGYWAISLLYACANLAIGLVVPAMTSIVMETGKSAGHMASATLNVNRQIGSLIGVALIGAIIDYSNDWYEKASHSFLLMAIIYLISAGLAGMLLKKKTF